MHAGFNEPETQMFYLKTTNVLVLRNIVNLINTWKAGYMTSKNEVLTVLESFVNDLGTCVDTHRLEELLQGSDTLKGGDVGSKPEPWTRKHLIRKLLDVAGLEWEPEIHGKGKGYPDFGIINLEVKVIGEDKSINKIEEAEAEIKEYLNNKAASSGAEYGIATDGIEWIVYRIELGGDYLDYSTVARIDLRDALQQIARNKKYIAQKSIAIVDVDRKAGEFFEIFSRKNFNMLLMQEAPKDIRAKKKKNIRAFYDLYVELLFGEGKGDYDYDTTLLDDVQAPYGVTETEKRKFAIKLVNRILFIKFLEDRGVLPNNFLMDRLNNYQKAKTQIDNIGGGLYKSLLEPLFFSLFNTPYAERLLKHRGGWFDKIPYLNGSLFAPEEREMEYDVDDRMLIYVVKDLVEGHRLQREGEGGFFDPSLLGNVFEMTINHISGEKNAQKKEGAYYTPNDVIKIITSQTVLLKIYEVLVEVYCNKIMSSSKELNEETARSIVMNYDLGAMLRRIEKREGYFGDPDAIREAYDNLGNLKVIDPACGSGHFLTAVLDEIHRVRLSLLRGLKGPDLNLEDNYQSKKELVLNCIYGVDINPIAVEIAKLRVWLKMVEEGWRENFGELPNININIVNGNSLIGLPVISGGQTILKKFHADMSEIQAVRQKYKNGKIDRRDLSRLIGSLRPELTDIYIDSMNHYFEHEIHDAGEFEKLVDSVDSFYPTVKTVRVERNDGREFSENERRRLEKIGFRCYAKSGVLKGKDIGKSGENLKRLLMGSFVLKFERRPTRYDVDSLDKVGDLSYKPFHWIIEFPEVAHKNSEDTIRFDIVVGNPPYGNILTDVEKNFTHGYKTGNMNDIAAQFVERELQILAENGYFGNVLTLRFIYENTALVVRKQLRRKLQNAKIACFTTRPSKIFDSSDPRVAIVTGKRRSETHKGESDLCTSKFIRFNEDDRERKLNNISYESTAGLLLGKKIGSGEDFSLPKVGDTVLKRILEKLKAKSTNTFRDVMSRDEKSDGGYMIWRKRGPQYWINPFLENLYGEGREPSDFDPMFFNSQLKANSAFLLMQSSIFYMFWMVYGDQRHLNWGLIEAFPFPEDEDLQANDRKINDLTNKIWEGMKERFDRSAGRTGEIQNVAELKPFVDEVDELFGPIFGLSEEEIRYVKDYDAEYGRSVLV
jgi:type I restriction-modification system DNA methylase subunit